jgi:hypothetical protein
MRDVPRNATQIAETFFLPVSAVRRAVRECRHLFPGFPTHSDGHWQRKFNLEEQIGLSWHCVKVYGARN